MRKDCVTRYQSFHEEIGAVHHYFEKVELVYYECSHSQKFNDAGVISIGYSGTCRINNVVVCNSSG